MEELAILLFGIIFSVAWMPFFVRRGGFFEEHPGNATFQNTLSICRVFFKPCIYRISGLQKQLEEE